MSELERYITIASLFNAALFYGITIIVFLVARKTALNRALALQKAIWLALIAFVALPAYIVSAPIMPGALRMACWLALSVVTWWVLYEVYRANWHDGWRAFLKHLWCETKRLPCRMIGKSTNRC